MSARTFTTSLALLGLIALVGGCGSDTISPTTNEAPMLPPQNVIVKQQPSGGVLISWDANTQVTLRGYNVYRRDTGGTSIERLTAQPITGTRHVDSQVDWQKEYEYRVTSVSTLGGESSFAASIIQLDTPPVGGHKQLPRW
ncbi:MAG: fibronectin type III domain-containing protein [Candidatus Krumholzibacteriia bacterium]